MKKTIVVKVEMTTRHPLYQKTLRQYKKFKVHDEENTAKPGDTVKIIESRPLSKEKNWRLLEVLKKEQGAASA